MKKHIVGIDPGPEYSAYILICLNDNNSFNIIDRSWVKNELLLKTIINKIITYSNIEFAIETIVSHGMTIGQTTIDTAIWAGRFLQFIKDLNIKSTFLTRPEVKLHYAMIVELNKRMLFDLLKIDLEILEQ